MWVLLRHQIFEIRKIEIIYESKFISPSSKAIEATLKGSKQTKTKWIWLPVPSSTDFDVICECLVSKKSTKKLHA